MVDYIGCARVQELVAAKGAARFIQELAAEIQADYCRWNDFDK
jgi:ornithine cyclodeaminase